MLKGHSTDFTHEDECTSHEKYYTAGENGCIICGGGGSFKSEKIKKSCDDVIVMLLGLSWIVLGGLKL